MSTEFFTPTGVPRYGPPQLSKGKSFDYAYADDDGIKESFLAFSLKVYELDKQLGKFANGCLKLGRVAGLLLAIKSTREKLGLAREVFFHNATALVPDLFELAREDCNSKARPSDSGRFYISPQYFKPGHLRQFDALPQVLEELGKSFHLLHVRVDEFREFTDEGLLLKSLLLTLDRDIKYRVSCAKFYSDRLNTPLIQRYIHQFTNELHDEFERITAALCEFTTVGVFAINHEQERSSSNLTNILTVSTFFSGVTASTLQMSTGRPDPNNTLLVANLLWFTSMIFSVGAALNSLLAMAWRATRSGSRGGKLPIWVTMWIHGSQLVFLGISILTFSAGLIVFAFGSSQASYTPYLSLASTAVTFVGLVAILFWMVYEMLVSPALRQQADVIVLKSSGDSVHSETSKFSLGSGGFAEAITHALPFLRFQDRDQTQDDVEKMEEKMSGPVLTESPTSERGFPDPLKTKLQSKVKNVGIINSALSALKTAGRRGEQVRYKKQRRPKPKPQMGGSSAAVPLTELVLSDEPSSIIELARYGTIHDVAYSEDGRWLAVTCTKEHSTQSWTGVFDAETLTTRLDTWHEGRVVSEHLKWSPSGKKLIVKFEHRFDVWDLDATVLHPIERHHAIQDVAWFGEDAFLVAEHNCVFKMNLTRIMAVYRFEHSHIRSIGFERRNNYLVLITRVARSPEQFEPACGRSEKRIVIYDMDKQAEIYQVPVLEDISSIHPIPGALDILITHRDRKAFQLWSLDAGIRGAEIMAKLKKRVITPHLDAGDYLGPTCIAGNYDQFVVNVTGAGDFDIWRRESGMPYLRFQPPVHRDEGIHCFSWRRSEDETATFATAGIDSHTLLVWRGEERLVPKTPASLESPILLSPRIGKGGSQWSRVTRLTGVASSGSLSPPEIEPIEETVTESKPKTVLSPQSPFM